MRGKRYRPETKAAILSAAMSARREGQAWLEAFRAAKAAGYHGSREGLEQMVRKVAKQRPRRGRPPKSAAQAQAPAGGIPALGALIEKLVKDQVRAALDKVIADLKAAQ